MSLLDRYDFLGDEQIAKLKKVEQTKPSKAKVPELQLDYDFKVNGFLFSLCRKSKLLNQKSRSVQKNSDQFNWFDQY